MKESLERMNQAKESASKKKSEAILAADDELAQAMGVVTLSLVAIAISVSISLGVTVYMPICEHCSPTLAIEISCHSLHTSSPVVLSLSVASSPCVDDSERSSEFIGQSERSTGHWAFLPHLPHDQ